MVIWLNDKPANLKEVLDSTPEIGGGGDAVEGLDPPVV